jgi:hypothetical protein
VATIWSGGCASSTGQSAHEQRLAEAEAEKASRSGPASRPYRPGELQIKLGDEKDDDVQLDFAQGYLNQADINDILSQHTGRLTPEVSAAAAARQPEGRLAVRAMDEASRVPGDPGFRLGPGGAPGLVRALSCGVAAIGGDNHDDAPAHAVRPS